jgi:hypothetical protein
VASAIGRALFPQQSGLAAPPLVVGSCRNPRRPAAGPALRRWRTIGRHRGAAPLWAPLRLGVTVRSTLCARSVCVSRAWGRAMAAGPMALFVALVAEVLGCGCVVSKELLCALVESWDRLGLAHVVFLQMPLWSCAPAQMHNGVQHGDSGLGARRCGRGVPQVLADAHG